MKKWLISVPVVLIIGFLFGGMVFSENTGVSFSSGILGDESYQTVQAVPQNNNSSVTTVSAVSGPLSVADIVEQSGPAVVNVESKIKTASSMNDPFFNDPFFREFFGDNFRMQPKSQYNTGIGTGFIISEDGYIITNQHVVNNAVEINVKLSGNEKAVPAKLIGQDYDLDLAVLKIEGNNYPTLPLGNSDNSRVGEWLVAIGQPYGLDHTVTGGLLSAKGRPIQIEDRSYKNLIQTDAAINPGNSGGPLLNMKGEVIGINTAVNAQAQGIGFAIPINTATEILQQLMDGENIIRPFLGISMKDVDQEAIEQLNLPAGTSGVLIAEVVPGSAAAKAGILVKDVIKGIDEKTIKTGADVQDYIKSKKVGDTINLVIIRQGYTIRIPAVLESRT